MIYTRDFETVQKTHSRELSGVKTLCFASSFLNLTIHPSHFLKIFTTNLLQVVHQAPSTWTKQYNTRNFLKDKTNCCKLKFYSLVNYNTEKKSKILRENDSGPRESGTWRRENGSPEENRGIHEQSNWIVF